MKTLTLLRHAKSGTDQPAMRDFDRALNDKGRRAAEAMGREMKRLDLSFDRVVASPAVRVVQTLEALATGYGRGLETEWDRRLYLATPDVLLEVAGEQDDAHERVLLVGHNPGLEQLVLELVAECCDGLRDTVADKYPTAGLAEMTVGEGWADLRGTRVTLTRFIRPRDVDASLGPDFD